MTNPSTGQTASLIAPQFAPLLAPTGRLRACINLGNPVLAARLEPNSAKGVSVDLANELAKELGLPLELNVVTTAALSVQAITDLSSDIGFFAIDPLRAQQIHFTAAYVLIEGYYLVNKAAPYQSNADVDKAGVNVIVGKGSAYDLFLSRELKNAQLVRVPNSQTVVPEFIATNKLDTVGAGVKQQLELDAAKGLADGTYRLLPQRFYQIQQAMGLPKSRDPQAAAYLTQFVERMKASGFVKASLERHGIQGAGVAPLTT